MIVVSPQPISTGQLDTPHGASTSGLSTRWSSGGLTPSSGWESSSWNELPA
eukprot:CAMPEP_0198713330 /NCGR_PEP_ID=MMETSP1471-20131121/5085_1 /TAXON_ID=41880 /ORGANISM="Pycnococcus provasolii, Strain RCC733" /LENGTH=50 /DNA_ID=CAMNT_0044473371 /DNA_START=12 /DNA_END=164 /DNA_ORIENTATION=-